MNNNLNNREVALRYLLGTLTEAEQETFERHSFGRADALDELAAVENDLIDQYLRSELSPAERGQFEKAYLFNSERAERVEFARALQQFLTERTREKPGVVPISEARNPAGRRIGLFLIAAVVALVAVGLILILEFGRSRREIRSALQENARLRGLEVSLREENRRLREDLDRSQMQAEREEAIQTPKATPSEGSQVRIASLILRPGLTREEASGQSVEIPRGTALVRLTVPVGPSRYREFEVVVETPDKAEVWRQGSLKMQVIPSGKAVSVEIPTSRLPGRDYILGLRGITPDGQAKTVGEYFFRLIKR